MVKVCPICGRMPEEYVVTTKWDLRFCYECLDFSSEMGRSWPHAEKLWNKSVENYISTKGESKKNERRKTIAWKRIYKSKAGTAANH